MTPDHASDAERDVSALLDEWLDSVQPAPDAVAPRTEDAAPAAAEDTDFFAADIPARAPASLLDAVTEFERQPSDSDVASTTAGAAAAEETPRYVLFTVAGAQYAVHQAYVTELDRVPTVTLVPNVPEWVRGITNRRGDILSVIDTRTLFGLERLAAGSGRMLVVRLLDDACALGLLVDDVQQIAGVPPGDIREPGSGLEGPVAPFLTGLFELGTRTVAVLDLDRLLRSSVIRQFEEPSDALGAP